MDSSLKSRKASLGNAWEDLRKHGASIAFTYLAIFVISVVSYIVFFVISLIFTQIGGGPYSDIGPLMGMIFGQVGQLPLTILSSLIGVLIYAIPAVYFSREEVVSFGEAVQILKAKPGRYILAGLFFMVAYIVGILLCFIPGLAVLFVMPIYVSKIFTTELSIFDSFSSSFAVVYKGEGWSFVGIQLIATIFALVAGLCACGIGVLITFPILEFYLMNVAYNKGLLTQ